MSTSHYQVANVGIQDQSTLDASQGRSFFTKSYRKHTPFALEPIRIRLDGNQTYGKKLTATLPRAADMLTRLYLQIDLEALAPGVTEREGISYVDDVGRAMIDYVELKCGNVLHDRLTGEMLHIWEEISVPKDRHLGRLTGKSACDATREVWAQARQRLYVPLEFYFQRDYGTALPLIAMHLSAMEVTVQLKKKEDCISPTYTNWTNAPYCNDGGICNMELLGEFVYLDDYERGMMAQSQIDNLMVQHQVVSKHVSKGETELDLNLNFNHPVKEFLFVTRTDTATKNKEWFNFAGQEKGMFAEEAFKSMTLNLNNAARVSLMDPLYYRIIQNSEYHTRIPDKHIYCYSISIAPESHSPAGSLNLSRIENTTMKFEFSEPLDEGAEFFVFARNINSVATKEGVQILSWAS